MPSELIQLNELAIGHLVWSTYKKSLLVYSTCVVIG